MRFFTPLALLPAAALAATFNGVRDTACQRYDSNYATVSAAQLEKHILAGYPSAKKQADSGRTWAGPRLALCPSNSDDTYAWIPVSEWSEGAPKNYADQSGMVAVVYYKETDTYNVFL
ncbi:hypothetical protein A1F95_02060 [Pyrenophora tritici-repentis]|nr:hypothetical protein A1F95_02060 [Pyrenophora tritici-repentis]